MSVFEITRDGPVATLWLANPDRGNAMGEPFWFGLPPLVQQLDAEESVRVIIVAAKGKQFSVGLDLKGGMGSEFTTFLQGGLAANRQKLFHTIKRMQDTCSVLARSVKPVIAAVHGYCIGGGLDLISACDLRYATKDAVVSLRETRIAMVADVGSLQRLPGIIGKGHLRDLAFTGRDFNAEEGKSMGLFNDTFDTQEALMKAVREKASAIAANSPLAVQGTKQVLNRADAAREADMLDYVALWNAAHLASDDLMEAMMAYMEKRPALFKGT